MNTVTIDTLAELRKICERFQRKASFQFAITDLVYWLHDKVNPEVAGWRTADRRKCVFNTATKKLIKYLLSLYRINEATGRFQEEDRMDGQGAVRITRKEILHQARITLEQYRLSIKVLWKKELIRFSRVRNAATKRFEESWVALDFANLENVIERLPELKRQKPGFQQVPPLTPGYEPCGVDPSVISIITGRQPVAEVQAACKLDMDKELSAEAEPSSCPGEKAYSQQAFEGAIPVEHQQIFETLRRIYPGLERTRDILHRVQSLNHRVGAFQLTADRANRLADILTMLPTALPGWIVNLKPGQLLTRSLWFRVARELNAYQHLHDAVDAKESIAEFAKDGQRLQQFTKTCIGSPDAAITALQECALFRNSDLVIHQLLYAAQRGWAAFILKPIQALARAQLRKIPLWMHVTAQFIDWCQVAAFDNAEFEKLMIRGQDEYRMAKWQVHLGAVYGCLVE